MNITENLGMGKHKVNKNPENAEHSETIVNFWVFFAYTYIF